MMKNVDIVTDLARALMNEPPISYAKIEGTSEYPMIHGSFYFYSIWQGSICAAFIEGLPPGTATCEQNILGFHIHEGDSCTGTTEDPLKNTGGHYNPKNCEHPNHAGDLPPLFANQGTAIEIFYTDRFFPEDIVGRTIVIHRMPDDFKSQPSGDSGMKIACGEVKMYVG